MGYSRYVSSEGLRPGITGESRTQSPPSPSTAERLLYISAAAPDLKVAIRNVEERKILWENKAALDAVVESFKTDLGARYSQLIGPLREAGLLTSQEFDRVATPKIDIAIVDLRAVRTPL
jgi:hypothetical protein